MRIHAFVLALCAAAAAQGAEQGSAERGRLLYRGELALVARIAGQDFALPAMASRCANCHSPSTSGATSPALADQQSVGPALTSALLTQLVRRRGGPPSRYDSAALCKLLRSGVDPAHVIIQRTMPRYDISDADCGSLWRHLSEPQARP